MTPPPADVPQLVYVYAVCRTDLAADRVSAQPAGLDGGRIRAVRANGLVALVSSVRAETFGTEGLRAQFEDLGRLEVLARTHHAVVEGVCEQALALPMRLATVYRDDQAVAGMLEDRASEFDALLSRLDGHVELGVKVYADPRDAGPQATDDESEKTEAGPGRAYLRRRRAQRESHAAVYRRAGSAVSHIPDRVGELAVASRTHRPQQGDLAPGAGENILNEAYLVPVDRVEDFRAALSDLAEEGTGVRLEITGPWAPYSFATPPERGERDEADERDERGDGAR